MSNLQHRLDTKREAIGIFVWIAMMLIGGLLSKMLNFDTAYIPLGSLVPTYFVLRVLFRRLRL